MKKTISLFIFLLFFLTAYPQQVQIEWQQCYGGSDRDAGNDVVVRANGHLAVLATTLSNDGDVLGNHGNFDLWLFETDEYGNLLWEKTFGGSEWDEAKSLIIAPDGGYLLFGYTFSNDGDVYGNHGGIDYWLVRTDSLGTLMWQRSIGSSVHDIGVKLAMDSMGYIYMIGLSWGQDGDVTHTNGVYDFWFLKLNLSGDIVWDKNLGTTIMDNGLCISPTNDGGIIVGGITDGIDGDMTCNTELGNETAWVVKLDSLNNIQWQQCYGGTYTESIMDIKNTSDRGYILLGLTNSNDGDVSGFHGYPGDVNIYDIWVVKVDCLGLMDWQRCLGGTKNEFPSFINITPEGNYLVGGSTASTDGDVSGNHPPEGATDHWIVKLNPAGEIIWQQCFGGDWNELPLGSYVLSESEFIIVGEKSTYSLGGDVDCENMGGDTDLWMYKILDTTVGISTIEEDKLPLKVYPNPATNSATFSYSLPAGNHQGSIEVHNTTGQMVASTRLNEAKGEWVLQLNNIPPGLYIYTLSTQQKTTTGKLVVIGE